MTKQALSDKRSALENDYQTVLKIQTASDKLAFLSKVLQEKSLSKFYKENRHLLNTLSVELQVVFDSLYLIGEGDRIFAEMQSFSQEKIENFLKSLDPIEKYYKEIGGIIGYHYTFVKMLLEKETPPPLTKKRYESPPGIDIDLDSKIKAYIQTGIDTLPQLAEVYPIAGAADRLNLKDPVTNEPLPAAQLHFLGYTLFEGLIRDLVGREYLYYKLHQRQITLPIVLMTSSEKNNFYHILEILEKNHWFHRPKESFFFLHQPLVPVMTYEGKWAVKAPLELVMKPGGHGVLWKLLQEQGAIDWLKQMGRSKLIIRQINNPVAGVDNGLLALSGIGSKEQRIFGFSSCERYLNSEEGMDVLVESETSEGFHYTITNVEYTEFEKQGIQDSPAAKDSPFSQFPANSNTLFADLSSIEALTKDYPLPGLMINLKSKTLCLNAHGELASQTAGRLESTMQNIADYIVTKTKKPLTKEGKRNLSVFVTYNKRRKTLASTKRAHVEGSNFKDTPESTFLEVMENGKDLLERCGFKVAREAPSFFTYHPALGPLYSVISQKIKRGNFHESSELKLEIAEILVEDLDIKGSLLITADQMTGKCILKKVTVANKGIDPSKPSIYWKSDIHRLESVNIKIEGNGEFFAENVHFIGNYNIIVPNNHRMKAIQKVGYVEFILEPISSPSWQWKYIFNNYNEIILNFDNYEPTGVNSSAQAISTSRGPYERRNQNSN